MLIELGITNIALVGSLTMRLSDGLNVLTGETGSGKSILVDCVNLVLGGKTDRELIRTGCDRGTIRAVFEISDDPTLKAALEDLGVEMDEDGLIEITRELYRNGRSISRISGTLLPLTRIREITQRLMDIHGQHEHQSLLQSSQHIRYLDAMGDPEFQNMLTECKKLYEERTDVSGRIQSLQRENAEMVHKHSLYTEQLQEIRNAKLRPDEEEKLTRKLTILENLDKIKNGIRQAHALLYENGRSKSAQESIKNAAESIESILDLDSRFAPYFDRLMDSFYTIQDISYDLQKSLDSLPDDDSKKDRIIERLSIINKLEEKYGATIEQVLEYEARIAEKIEGMDEQSAMLRAYTEKLAELDERLRDLSLTLHKERTDIAARLETELMKQLDDMNMKGTRFSISITEKENRLSARGCDEVEFLISPNPGEPLKPLASIASGGELSRIMLAFKIVFMNADGIDSMVFDEIDTGISGRAAQTVAEKLCRISNSHQVLCVTHLPQIAVMGDAQYLVQKSVIEGRTVTTVEQLEPDDRIRVIANMISGVDVEEESGSLHAKNLLETASRKRKEIRASIN